MARPLPRKLGAYLRKVRSLVGTHGRGIYLFGSRATGSERPNSDFDIAIFLDDDAPLRKMRRAASDAAFRFVVQDYEIRPVVLRHSVLHSDSQFARHVREVGLRLA